MIRYVYIVEKSPKGRLLASKTVETAMMASAERMGLGRTGIFCPIVNRPQIRVSTSSYGEKVNFCAILVTSLDIRPFDCLKCSGDSC